MNARWIVVVFIAQLLVSHGCRRREAALPGQDGKAPRVGSEPRIGIDVRVDDRGVTFRFKICGAKDGEPVVDRLVVEKIKPAADKGTMCSFESESEEGVLRDDWRYGEKRPGLGRCWPLTEGEYVAGAIGSGAGQTRFKLTKRWFGSGLSVGVLDAGCE